MRILCSLLFFSILTFKGYSQAGDSLITLGPRSETIDISKGKIYEIDSFGIARLYYQYGKLKAIGKFSQRGKYTWKTGLWTYYDETGQLIRDEFYSKKGRLKGSKVYREPDTCYIDILNDSIRKEYNCNVFVYSIGDKPVFTDPNIDKGFFVNSILHNSQSAVFEYYDSPTGRRKLLLFNLAEKEILLSSWFDDSAVGDSVDVQTINFESKSFKVSAKYNKDIYTVRFEILKDW